MFKMTERAKAAKVRREWYCDVCEHQWRTVEDEDETAEPECPECEGIAEQVRRPVGVVSIQSKARDVVWDVAQKDYGATNMRDDIREGERLNIGPPPIQAAEAEAIVRATTGGSVPEPAGEALKSHVQSFWGAADSGQMAPQNPMQAAIRSQVPQSIDAARMMAAPAAQAARSMGSDPVGLLHGPAAKAKDPLAKRNLTIMSKNQS